MKMKIKLITRCLTLATMIATATPFISKSQVPVSIPSTDATKNAGLTLPNGFGAKVIADNLGKARHLIVTPQHDIYVRLARTVKGNGTLLLHEENDKASVVYGFGNFGGTGVYLRDSYLYTASNSEIFALSSQIKHNSRLINDNTIKTDCQDPKKLTRSLRI